MKCLVLYWDDEPDDDAPRGLLIDKGWTVHTWQTNKRKAVAEFNRCRKDHRYCKLVSVGEVLAEQTDYEEFE